MFVPLAYTEKVDEFPNNIFLLLTIVTSSLNVDIPATDTLSRLVWPSTSISPLRSILVAVIIPAIISLPPVIVPTKGPLNLAAVITSTIASSAD